MSKQEFEHWDKNKMLDFYASQTKAYIADCQIKKKPFSIEDLKTTIFGRAVSGDYFEFAKSEINGDITLSKETKRTYLAKLSKLKRFRSKLSLHEIDYTFLMGYKKWMIEGGNEINTWNKDFSIIRSFLNRAINRGLIGRHDFDKVKIKNVEGKREFLTMDDFITLNMHKTNKPVDIPLMDEAKKMLPDIGQKSDSETVFTVPTNQVFNRYLKELAKIAGIKKTNTLHCARHTFATLALDNGMKLEVISKILGHSSLKVTLIYAKILQSQKVESMNAFNQAIAGM